MQLKSHASIQEIWVNNCPELELSFYLIFVLNKYFKTGGNEYGHKQQRVQAKV